MSNTLMWSFYGLLVAIFVTLVALRSQEINKQNELTEEVDRLTRQIRQLREAAVCRP